MTDVERFTEGDCWVLAGKIHKLVGWPIKVAELGHVVNELPDGRIVDVEGIHERKTFIKEWGNIEPDAKEWNHEFRCAWGHADGQPAFSPSSNVRAALVAPKLIKQATT